MDETININLPSAFLHEAHQRDELKRNHNVAGIYQRAGNSVNCKEQLCFSEKALRGDAIIVASYFSFNNNARMEAIKECMQIRKQIELGKTK